MTLIENLRSELQDYATDFCKTEIINFAEIPSGSNLTTGEKFRFKVKVSNESHLNMEDVKIKVSGTMYADVSVDKNDPDFDNYIISNKFNLSAHQSYTTAYYYGKAKRVTLRGAAKTIVQAKIHNWDANLEHLLDYHSYSGDFEGKLVKAIARD